MKKLFFGLLYGTGVTRLVAWWHRRQTVFLCYHSVTRRPQPIPHELKLHMPLALFASHLDYLQRHCRVISLAEYLAARRDGRRLPDNSVVLTFDDGTRNFFTVVAPLLAERALPATAFVITKSVSERDGLCRACEWTPADDHTYLSWPEVRALAESPGIEIGSHSHTHPDLTALPPGEAERELRDSYEAVVENTGEGRPALAYPHGRMSGAVREMAASLGYSCALTDELGGNVPEADLFELRRVVVAGDDELATFAARVSGVTWWYDCGRTFFRRARAKVGGARGRAGGAHDHKPAGLVQMKKPSSGSIP